MTGYQTGASLCCMRLPITEVTQKTYSLCAQIGTVNLRQFVADAAHVRQIHVNCRQNMQFKRILNPTLEYNDNMNWARG